MSELGRVIMRSGPWEIGQRESNWDSLTGGHCACGFGHALGTWRPTEERLSNVWSLPTPYSLLPTPYSLLAIKKNLAEIALSEVLKVPGNDLFSRLSALSWAPAA